MADRKNRTSTTGDNGGLLQTDGYAAYDKVGGPGLVHAACWAHARRKFVEVGKVNPGDARAAGMVLLMDRLFAIDGEARDRELNVEERRALRAQRCTELLQEIHSGCERAQTETLPASASARAANYTLHLWKKQTAFLDYLVVELSNNLAENSMRPVALGRKNWTHVGSQKAGPKVAAILSVVESCRRLDVPAGEYLLTVLPGLADRPVKAIATMTPGAWLKLRRG